MAAVHSRNYQAQWTAVGNYVSILVFDALTLLVGCQKEHLPRKKLSDEMLIWLSVCSKMQMICIWSS